MSAIGSAMMLLTAQAAATGDAPAQPGHTYGPETRATQPVKTAVASPEAACQDQVRQSDIVICAQRPNGYRLDPDVMKARRDHKQDLAGRPHNPHETFADHSCATVGPMGCRGGPTINLLSAAATAAEMGKRLASGQEIGSMFVTDPHPTEYQLYLAAKHEREAEAAAKAADAVKAKAEAAAKAKAAATAAEKP